VKYRRSKVTGASYFFTLVTHGRHPILSSAEAVALFESSVSRIKSTHPFDVDAFVILPDHIHTVWTLPDGDANFPMRWRLIKEAFTKPFVRAHGPPGRSQSRHAKSEQAVCNAGIGSMSSAMTRISRGT